MKARRENGRNGTDFSDWAAKETGDDVTLEQDLF
jgi:hypothetical protein